jgi:hypothetical protein
MDVTDTPNLGPVDGLTSSTLPAFLTPRHPVRALYTLELCAAKFGIEKIKYQIPRF